MTLAAALILSASAPGSAREVSESVNDATALPVPALVQVPEPATTLADLVGTRPAEPAEYGTLAAAVAAQTTSEAEGVEADEDLSCMAGAIYFEAKSEPLAGQLAVAEVILNRTRSGRFPKSICSVVTQPGQFSFVRQGRMPAIAPNSQYQTAVAVARVALGDKWDSPASDAMYFHARRVAPGWSRKTIATIGNHVFYR